MGRVAPENLAIVEAGGDSMEKTIKDRDPIVDLSDKKLTNGQIYVFRIEESVQVKRIQRNVGDGSITLMSDNDKYPPEMLGSHDIANLHVIGRVLWNIRPL